MNFTLYTRDGCPYCTQVKQVLNGKQLNFVEYKLGKDFQREAFYGQFGQGSTFPQVVLLVHFPYRFDLGQDQYVSL